MCKAPKAPKAPKPPPLPVFEPPPDLELGGTESAQRRAVNASRSGRSSLLAANQARLVAPPGTTRRTDPRAIKRTVSFNAALESRQAARRAEADDRNNLQGFIDRSQGRRGPRQ